MKIWSLSVNKGDVVLGALFVTVVVGLVYHGISMMSFTQADRSFEVFK